MGSSCTGSGDRWSEHPVNEPTFLIRDQTVAQKPSGTSTSAPCARWRRTRPGSPRVRPEPGRITSLARLGTRLPRRLHVAMAASQAACDSEKRRHHTSSAGGMASSQRARCAGVPKRMSVGPTMLTLTGSRIPGARARAISSAKTICSTRLAPRLPCSRDHWMPTQPPSASACCQARWERCLRRGVGDAEHAFARSRVLQSRRRRQGRRRRVPRAHAPRGAEASTRAPRRVRGPPPRRTPAVRDSDRPTPPPSRAPRAETGAERPRAGKTTRPHERWEEWRTLRPPPRRATGRRHGAGGGDEDRQRRR